MHCSVAFHISSNRCDSLSVCDSKVTDDNSCCLSSYRLAMLGFVVGNWRNRQSPEWTRRAHPSRTTHLLIDGLLRIRSSFLLCALYHHLIALVTPIVWETPKHVWESLRSQTLLPEYRAGWRSIYCWFRLYKIGEKISLWRQMRESNPPSQGYEPCEIPLL